MALYKRLFGNIAARIILQTALYILSYNLSGIFIEKSKFRKLPFFGKK
jgi:hypothetical protein